MAIFLDYQSTTPLDSRVLEAMQPYFSELYFNPSSAHQQGQHVQTILSNARASVAGHINSLPNEVLFTGGATEAINLAIQSMYTFGQECHIITQATEHSAVLQTCQYLESCGVEVTYLPVGKNGIIDLIELKGAFREHTALVCIMHANNEIGTIQPVEKIGNLCRSMSVPYFVDASQTIGKIRVDVEDSNIDFLAMSSHKFYGPKGVGALYIRKELQAQMRPLVYGGGQEFGLRSGTLNIPGIIGMSKALEISCAHMEEEDFRTLRLRNLFLTEIQNELSNIEINGDIENRLSGNLNITFRNVSNDVLINQLSNIVVSKGSACNSTKTDGSHVLKAIGLNADEIESTIRIGIGRFTTEEEIFESANELITTVTRIRKISSL